jgi:hypothetical protein
MSIKSAKCLHSKGPSALSLALLLSGAVPLVASAQAEPPPAEGDQAAAGAAAEGDVAGDWGAVAEAPIAPSEAAVAAEGPAAEDRAAEGEPAPSPSSFDPYTTPMMQTRAHNDPQYYFRVERLVYQPADWNIPVRGIPGGSMETIWHGLQWPYYPKTGLALSGWGWVDTGYEQQDRSLSTENDRAFWLQQGYLDLRISPTWSNGNFFVQAQADILAWHSSIKGDLPVDVDDAYIKFGQWGKWDFQAGRFEAWEIYHKGMGFERNTLEDIGAFDARDTTVVDIYEVNYAFFRQDGYGQAALHYYPFKWLRFEAAGVLGNESGFNALGVRPVGILDFGFIKLKLGGEYKKERDWEKGQKREAESRGAGGSLQFVFNPYLEGGLNAAYGIVDRIGPDGRVDEKGSPTTASVGGFLNARPWGTLVLGAGYNYTDQDNRQYNSAVDDVGHFSHSQYFGAIQHAIFIPQLTAKVVASYAKARLDESFDNDKTNKMMSVRLRLKYVF